MAGSDSDSKSPIKVDVGAKASASFEMKAEVPKESAGRLVDALTDAIRPWTEKRGLKADLIRLQREDIALEIAKKARQRLAVEQIDLKPISTKLLIPFLEKASLEDKDVGLRDAWTALLVSATKTERARHLTFVDILSRISSEELRLLERVCFAYDRFPERSYPGGHVEENRGQIHTHFRTLMLDAADVDESREAAEKFVSDCKLTYAELTYVSVRSTGDRYFYFGAGVSGSAEFQALDILQRERLIDIEHVQFPAGGVKIGYFNVTPLGIDFVKDCSPLADEMAARRPPPVKLEPITQEVVDKIKQAMNGEPKPSKGPGK
jgi:hypothetical protein